MGFLALIVGIITAVSAVKYHTFGFDGSLAFFDEFLTEVFKTYTGAENVDLYKCMHPDFLQKFEDNLVTIDQKIKDLNLFDAALTAYVLVDDIVRFSNICDAGFNIPTHIIADNAIQIGFYVNIATKSEEIQGIIKECYGNLMMGFFKGAGKNIGQLMKILFPLETQHSISNDHYFNVISELFNEIADQSAITKCSERITSIISAASNIISKASQLSSGNLMAISSLIFEIKPLISNIQSLSEVCQLSAATDKLISVLADEGIKYSIFRYYLNKEKITEIANGFINGEKSPEETGKLLGQIINIIFGWNTEKPEKVSDDIYNKVMHNALMQEGEKCPEIVNKALENIQKVKKEYTEKATLLRKFYNKSKSKLIKHFKTCGIKTLLTAFPFKLSELEDILKKDHKTTIYGREDL
ncbi:unnamed protein product [Blepharisma stoltei]|uniref:Uncharacterized protein n=1 Tax=Blepharisma stoltei TaxID=1481888 RepID=A0AAU9JNJ6_9CILI|nr:unnamed protein product [Blepharisma stoltei]